MAGKLFAHIRRQWMGALALFLVLSGGVAYAGATITGSDVVDGSLTTADYKNNDIRSADLRAGEVRSADVQNFDGEVPGTGLKNEDIASNAVAGFNVQADTLGAFHIADIATLEGKLQEVDDDPAQVGPSAVNLVNTGGLLIQGQCTDQGGAGGILAKVVVIDNIGGRPFSVDSSAPGGVNGLINVGSEQPIAALGATTDPRYEAGSYFVTQGAGAVPQLMLPGQVVVGTNIHGTDCVLGATGIG